jgi:hypothetical protein
MARLPILEIENLVEFPNPSPSGGSEPPKYVVEKIFHDSTKDKTGSVQPEAIVCKLKRLYVQNPDYLILNIMSPSPKKIVINTAPSELQISIKEKATNYHTTGVVGRDTHNTTYKLEPTSEDYTTPYTFRVPNLAEFEIDEESTEEGELCLKRKTPEPIPASTHTDLKNIEEIANAINPPGFYTQVVTRGDKGYLVFPFAKDPVCLLDSDVAVFVLEVFNKTFNIFKDAPSRMILFDYQDRIVSWISPNYEQNPNQLLDEEYFDRMDKEGYPITIQTIRALLYLLDEVQLLSVKHPLSLAQLTSLNFTNIQMLTNNRLSGQMLELCDVMPFITITPDPLSPPPKVVGRILRGSSGFKWPIKPVAIALEQTEVKDFFANSEKREQPSSSVRTASRPITPAQSEGQEDIYPTIQDHKLHDPPAPSTAYTDREPTASAEIEVEPRAYVERPRSTSPRSSAPTPTVCFRTMYEIAAFLTFNVEATISTLLTPCLSSTYGFFKSPTSGRADPHEHLVSPSPLMTR